MEILLRHQPHIVHFSGHGSDEAIFLLNEHNEARAVSTEALAETFRALKDNIRLVFLNSCFSAVQVEAIGQHIEFVLGMGREVSNQAASAFASSFYLAIGHGRTVQNAFDIARADSLVEGLSGDSEPVLRVAQDACAQTTHFQPGGWRVGRARVSRAADKPSQIASPASPEAPSRPMPTKPQSGHPFEEAMTGMRFLWIPGGRFVMGADDVDEACPAHWVEVSPYWLAQTPVTNRQYRLFVQATGGKEPRSWRDRRFNQPEQPVVEVSWSDATAFCQWLSAESGHRIDLPTEAQWEFAARGLDSWVYPWGNEEPNQTRAHFDRIHGS